MSCLVRGGKCRTSRIKRCCNVDRDDVFPGIVSSKRYLTIGSPKSVLVFYRRTPETLGDFLGEYGEFKRSSTKPNERCQIFFGLFLDH